ncbi:UvrD/REP helicase (plasmid) [Deinococcus gobiensis I-0]|uniref:DNA 3'-5' helicase n=2 Tax=Deinococcus TaxID=1298 RepID=H8H187_DEIGI|nr:UvrD/REP helicase [Deinococcus gobiensis I-0]
MTTDTSALAPVPGGHPEGMTLLFDDLEPAQRGKKMTIRAKRTPSHYQQAVLDDISAGVQAVLVSATAGSGKTSLLEMIATHLKGQALLPKGAKVGFLSYNQHIAKALRQVIPPEFDVRTVNSLGDQIIRLNLAGTKFEPEKYRQIVQGVVDGAGIASPAARRELRERLTSTVELHVGHDLGLRPDFAQWVEVMLEVDAPIMGAEDALYRFTSKVLREGLVALRDAHVRSFLDQVLAPSVFGWTLPQPYDFLLVDELQDLSRGQLNLMQAATSTHSRVVGVGDRHQSLYAFNGADTQSLPRFTALFGAVERPLSITYRCPRKHVALARHYTDAIEAAPQAQEGLLEDLSSEQFVDLVRPGDLVLCRTNAPLVEWCYRLIAERKPAMVRGRDLAKTLVAFARDAATFNGTKPCREKLQDRLPVNTPAFLAQLNAYAEVLAQKYTREAERDGKEPDMRIAALADRIQAVLLVLEKSGAQTLNDLVEAIRLLCAGDPERSIVLTTVHGAKGLEAKRVFIVEPDLLPHPKATSAQAQETERCVQFVAFTRAKEALYFVDPSESRLPLAQG